MGQVTRKSLQRLNFLNLPTQFFQHIFHQRISLQLLQQFRGERIIAKLGLRGGGAESGAVSAVISPASNRTPIGLPRNRVNSRAIISRLPLVP